MPSEFDSFDLEVSKFAGGAFSSYDMELFVPEVKKIPKGGLYVEIGVDRGKSLCTAFLSNEEIDLVGIDIVDHPERQKWSDLLDKSRRITFIHGDSLTVVCYFSYEIDLLFVDGDHSYDQVSREIEAWGKLIKPGGVILFHDCDVSSPGVLKAVTEKFGKKVEFHNPEGRKSSMAKVQL